MYTPTYIHITSLFYYYNVREVIYNNKKLSPAYSLFLLYVLCEYVVCMECVVCMCCVNMLCMECVVCMSCICMRCACMCMCVCVCVGVCVCCMYTTHNTTTQYNHI